MLNGWDADTDHDALEPWRDRDDDGPATRAQNAVIFAVLAIAALPWVAVAGGLLWVIWIVTR